MRAEDQVHQPGEGEEARSRQRPRPGPSRALVGEQIVCFSNDWGGAPLSKTHLMRLLARDNRVLWVGSLGNRAPRASARDLRRLARKAVWAAAGPRQVAPNLTVFSPLALPLPGSEWARPINRLALRAQLTRVMARLGFDRPIVWSFLPSAEWVATSLPRKMLVYHAVDEFTAFTGAPAQAVAAAEARLIAAADLVIVSAQKLLENKRALHPRTVLVQHGVAWERFARALDPATHLPPLLARMPRPVLGFFGLLEDWIDLELVARVARRWPQGSVVLLGAVRTSTRALQGLANVHLLGPRPYDELPAWCKGFDVALIPFRDNALTQHANPLKAREYLAAGLPVVSTAIPEVERLGMCRVGRTPQAFIEQVEQALRRPGPNAAVSEAMRAHSWEARVEEIRAHVAAAQAGGAPWPR